MNDTEPRECREYQGTGVVFIPVNGGRGEVCRVCNECRGKGVTRISLLDRDIIEAQSRIFKKALSDILRESNHRDKPHEMDISNKDDLSQSISKRGNDGHL